MTKTTKIPEVYFPNRQQKSFGFEIINNRRMLLYDLPTDHNPFRPHRLRFYAILFIRQGQGVHFIDFKKYPYKRGSIIFISKEQVHAFEKNLDREASFLLFTEEFLERSSLSSNLMQQLSLYNYHLYKPILQLTEEEIPIFSSIVNRMELEFQGKDDFATEEIILSSLKIFLCLAERIRKKSIDSQSPSVYRDEFKQFQKLLKKNLLQNRQVKFYADAMNISTKKLNRITKEVMNQPAKTYISEYLVLEMKRFLTNTNLSIKEIAYQTGFEDPTNFVKFFKKYSKMTPAEFRKQNETTVQF